MLQYRYRLIQTPAFVVTFDDSQRLDSGFCCTRHGNLRRDFLAISVLWQEGIESMINGFHARFTPGTLAYSGTIRLRKQPTFSTLASTKSPGLSHQGVSPSFLPAATPRGVPVVSTSPGLSPNCDQ